jgi:geranylgeranyl diphosphate synthase, type I
MWVAMRTELAGGQFLDPLGQVHPMAPVAVDSAATRVNRFKTAAYTVERPLELGAALAGAPARLTQAYRRYGADIGAAFQLRDDLLGMFGDPEVTGKPTGDDLREGKRTVLLALAVRAATHTHDQATLELLTRSLGNPELDPATVHQVREALRRLGVPDRLEQRITELTDSALAALATAELPEPAATRLPQLAHAATRRHA